MEDKKMLVSALENGTVLDHIPCESVYKILDILDLKKIKQPITIGINLKGKRGRKGIIKIADKFFKPSELGKLAIIAPGTIVNVIKDFNVVQKNALEIPPYIEGVVKCRNPKCVTNQEDIKTKFETVRKGDTVSLKCHYCEKITELL